MSDEQDRENAAAFSAQRFLIEILLAELFHRIKVSGEDVEPFIEKVLLVSRKTGHLSAANDHVAEVLSDVAVRTQAKIEEIVTGAMERHSGPTQDRDRR